MTRRPKRGRPQDSNTDSRTVGRQGGQAFQEQIDIFRLLLDSLEAGTAIVSVRGIIHYANPHFADLIAASAMRPLIEANLRSFVSASSWPALELALRRSSHVPSEGQMEVQAVSGSTRTVRVCFVPLASQEPEPLIGIVATEVTKLVAAAQALKDSEASLQSLSARLLRLQDEERRHMARDLHDSIGQELAVAVMRVEQIAKEVGSPEADLRNKLVECSEWLRKIESETRTLSYVLHPPLLDQMGLLPALRWYIEGFAKRSGLKVQLDVNSKVPRLDVEQETALFRIVQESLTNVLRHSGSAEAKVRITVENNSLSVSVEDKGKGFKDQASGEKATSAHGVGIAGMRGRLSLVQGSLDIRSTANGTKVSARVPLREDERAAPLPAAPLPAAPLPAAPFAEGSVARILIADDHEIARRGIRDLFRDEKDMEICGEACDGVEALSKAEELHPDLLILDLSMPKLGGFSVAHQLRSSDPSAKVLIYSTHAHPQVERMVRSAGCSGFVHKANAGRDLVRGARTILRGGTFFEGDTSRSQSA